MIREARTYEEAAQDGPVLVLAELMQNGVVCTVTFAEDGEIRYSVTKNGTVLYNEAMTRYSARMAAKLSREQYEVATRTV